ncbi:MAG: hypothetical protein RL490_245, partial [Pseudomonadota bacterium]
PAADIAALAAVAGLLTVDLPAQTVTGGDVAFRFAIGAEAKAMLIGGLDAIDLTLLFADRIADWTARNRAARPWVYLGPA